MTGKRGALAIQVSVIQALMLREMTARFGGMRLGYFWAVAQPSAQVLVFCMIFGMRGSAGMPLIDYPVFVATGLLPWSLFKTIVTGSMNAVSANAALMNYRQVQAIDTLLARILLEMALAFVVLTILLVSFIYAGFTVTLRDPIEVLQGVGFLIVLGAGLGMLACVLSARMPDATRFIPIAMAPLFFLSGVFFHINTVPDPYRDWLMWNPILHGIEMIRDGFFSTHRQGNADAGYLAMTAFPTFCAGLFVFRIYRRRLAR